MNQHSEGDFRSLSDYSTRVVFPDILIFLSKDDRHSNFPIKIAEARQDPNFEVDEFTFAMREFLLSIKDTERKIKQPEKETLMNISISSASDSNFLDDIDRRILCTLSKS